MYLIRTFRMASKHITQKVKQWSRLIHVYGMIYITADICTVVQLFGGQDRVVVKDR